MHLPSSTTPEGLFDYIMIFVILAAILGYAVLFFGG